MGTLVTVTAIVHPRQAARRGGRLSSWWAKAWLRAVEEAAYGERELRIARGLARDGRVGGIIVDSGSFAAAVEDAKGMWTVSGTVPVLEPVAVSALVEAVAATAARIAGLLAGELPHELVGSRHEAVRGRAWRWEPAPGNDSPGRAALCQLSAGWFRNQR